MKNITFTTLEDKWPVNNFNILALNITNPMIPSHEITNRHIVYHGTLHVYNRHVPVHLLS